MPRSFVVSRGAAKSGAAAELKKALRLSLPELIDLFNKLWARRLSQSNPGRQGERRLLNAVYLSEFASSSLRSLRFPLGISILHE
jgi:hypothetical protein